MVSFNREEVDYIKNTWRVAAQNIHNCGEVIFFKFFEKFPSYIVQFPKFKHSSLVQLKNSGAFKNHAFVIMTHIGDTVTLLGTPNGDEAIKKIWQAHGELHIPLKVKKLQFNQFRDVCIQQILEISNLQHVDEVKRAWLKLFNLVFSYSFEISGAE